MVVEHKSSIDQRKHWKTEKGSGKNSAYLDGAEGM